MGTVSWDDTTGGGRKTEGPVNRECGWFMGTVSAAD